MTAATGQLRLVDPRSDPTFARLAFLFPDVTPFHCQPWALTLIHAYGHRPFYHMVEMPVLDEMSADAHAYLVETQRSRERAPTIPPPHRSTEIPNHRNTKIPSHRPTAFLPLMEVSSPLTGRRGVALPFTDLAPALFDCELTRDEQDLAFQELWSAAVALGRQRGWRSIELRGGPAPPTCRVPSITFHGHELELTRNEAQLFRNLHPAVRRAIRKSRQCRVRVESSHTLEALHDYYGLHVRTRRRHGLPPQPFRFFLRLYDHVISTGHGFIALARSGRLPIAGAVFLHAGRCAVFKYGASDPVHQSFRANDLLFWETIQRLAADGFDSLHFGRTDLGQDGLRRFKLGWGTRERQIRYHRFCLRSNAFVTTRHNVDGWHNAWFRRLPIRVNRILGSLVYRHLD